MAGNRKPPHCPASTLLLVLGLQAVVPSLKRLLEMLMLTSPLNKRPHLIEYKFVFIEAAVT